MQQKNNSEEITSHFAVYISVGVCSIVGGYVWRGLGRECEVQARRGCWCGHSAAAALCQSVETRRSTCGLRRHCSTAVMSSESAGATTQLATEIDDDDAAMPGDDGLAHSSPTDSSLFKAIFIPLYCIVFLLCFAGQHRALQLYTTNRFVLAWCHSCHQIDKNINYHGMHGSKFTGSIIWSVI